MFSGFSADTSSPFGYISQTFAELFRCYPIPMMNDRIRKDEANFGGKIFLPPSALNKLSMLNIRYPMLFELTVNETGKVTHSGVLEFTAEEGRAYLPSWMFDTLGIQPGTLLTVRSTDLPLGQFVKLEPQSVDFLDISDPKAVLENVLRNFSTLTVDDIIEISYNNKYHKIKILEVKPDNGNQSICVVETDLVTDFAPPVGYVEPDYKAMQAEKIAQKKKKIDPNTVGQGSMSTRLNYTNILNQSNTKDSKFTGSGEKLSGKKISSKKTMDLKDIKISLDGEPSKLDLPEGQLFFGFPITPPKSSDEDDENNLNREQNFHGQGQSLRKSSKRKTKKDHTSSKPKAPKSPEVIEID